MNEVMATGHESKLYVVERRSRKYGKVTYKVFRTRAKARAYTHQSLARYEYRILPAQWGPDNV